MIKKIVSIILFASVMSLSGCGKDDEKTSEIVFEDPSIHEEDTQEDDVSEQDGDDLGRPTMDISEGQNGSDWDLDYETEYHSVSVNATTLKIMADKPVIYLYNYNGDVNVKLDLDDGELTCTYPTYMEDGWDVIASPDGHLKDKDGKTYRYLYWEGKTDTVWDFDKGFCIKGKDTAGFLERTLREQGLDDDEINEFIIYWLPQMQDNEYNVISFQTDAYTDSARLKVTPGPDTMIRVFMAWYPSEMYLDIEPQTFTPPVRTGKTVVEWGGSKIR